jgi:uncharacterized membrane protein YphA (DoxX/SURF4 family)
MNDFQTQFDRLDRRITTWMARYGLLLLRLSLGIVFFWFGFLKFFPDLSPAQDLATRTIEVLSFGLIPPEVAIYILAVWECLIGLGLIVGRFMRVTLLLLFLQMLGTITPVFLFPDEVFTRIPLRADAGRTIHHQEHGADQRRSGAGGDGARRRDGRRAGPADRAAGCGATGGGNVWAIDMTVMMNDGREGRRRL